MVKIAMDPPVAAQPHDVEMASGMGGPFDGTEQDLVVEERTVTNAPGDAHDLLFDDSTRADILVSDFAVTHDAGWKTDVVTACANLYVRKRGHQGIVDRSTSQVNGVRVIPLGKRIRPPSVPDDQDNGSNLSCVQNRSLSIESVRRKWPIHSQTPAS